MHGSLIRSALWGLLVAAAHYTPSAAAEAVDIADRLVAAMSGRGDTVVTYDAVTTAGETIVITGLKSVEIAKTDRIVLLPVVTITGAANRESGGFTADRIDFDGGSVNDGARRIVWGVGTSTEAVIPSPEEVKTAAKIRPFAGLRMDDIRVLRSGGETALSVEVLTAEIGEVIEGAPSQFSIDAQNITASVSLVGGVRRRALLEAIGYHDFKLDLSLDSKVDLFDDIWLLDPLILDIEDFGKVRITGRFSGVSIGGFVTNSRRVSAQEAAKVERISFRFDNDGLVERALDMQASMMGVERPVFVENFIGAVPFMLNFIGNPPFQAKLASVAADFLREPRSVTIDSVPPTPVSLEEIMKTARANRSVLPDLLSMEVTVNE